MKPNDKNTSLPSLRKPSSKRPNDSAKPLKSQKSLKVKLSEQFSNNVALDVGQPEIAASVAVRQAFVIQAEQIQ